jgi:hypothetical protein
LLLLDGTVADFAILQPLERLVAIMQDGNFHRLDRNAVARRGRRSSPEAPPARA